jgi:hypothetical protein
VTGPIDTPVPDDTSPAHPVTGLDEVVHQRVRLGILTIAHEARRAEFDALRSVQQIQPATHVGQYSADRRRTGRR